MKITVDVELLPFTVPNYVLVAYKPRPREEGMAESPKYHLSELDAETLEKLCDQFRVDVFKKAGKEIA